MIQQAVFIQSMKTRECGTVTVTASNGGVKGPPIVKFDVSSSKAQELSIGQRLLLGVTDIV